MKIQCSCGTKVAFEITPEMATNPVQFVCPNCGLDSSLMVNQLIRQQLGVSAAPPTPPPPVHAAPSAPPPIPPPMPPPPPAPVAAPVPKPAMRIAMPSRAPDPAEGDAAGGSEEKQFCLKHPGKLVSHKCVVCGKPMCPDCMAISGYACSPLCRSKAESRGLDIPVYALQKSVVESRRWRKIGLVSGGIGAVIALLAGFWFWYAWFGCVPRVAYAMRFPDRAKAGKVCLAGKDNLVFIHGPELGRIVMTQTQAVWSVQLVTTQQFTAAAEQTIKELIKARDHYYATAEEPGDFKIPSREDVLKRLYEGAVGSLQLHVAGENIWVASGGKMTSYDWQTGKPGKEVALEGSGYGMLRKGDELVLREYGDDPTTETTRHINLRTGETTHETTEKPFPPKLMALLTTAATNPPARPSPKNGKASSAAARAEAAKIIAAAEARRPGAPLDPQKIASDAQDMPFAAKLALPALIANARNQQRLEAELAGDTTPFQPTELGLALEEWDNTRVIPAADGLVQFTSTLIEKKIVQREAMKAAPKKSALDGNVSAANSLAVAGEMLNEMQREVSSTVTENVSRYRVTVKRAGATTPAWTGEVTGPPSFHPLKSVDIIAAGTTAIALDHSNKKLWQASLNFPVSGGMDEFDEFDAGPDAGMQGSGLGPCVERGDTVYIYDQGSLAAFDRATGAARWRLPSVGISGLWFDDKGMIYVNTTTAGPESIRYSKQINLNSQTLTQILKVDPKTGKTLWSREGAKHISYMWKKYIYTTDRFEGSDPDGEGMGNVAGVEFPPFIRIRRINAGSGRIVWEHVQKRCPLDMHFHENTIQLMFRKEVQHLKILTL